MNFLLQNLQKSNLTFGKLPKLIVSQILRS